MNRATAQVFGIEEVDNDHELSIGKDSSHGTDRVCLPKNASNLMSQSPNVRSDEQLESVVAVESSSSGGDTRDKSSSGDPRDKDSSGDTRDKSSGGDSRDKSSGVDTRDNKVKRRKGSTYARQSEKRQRRWVQLPSVKERKQARQENRVHAYGVRGSKQCRVCLREQDANAKKGDGEIKLFDSWNDVARNIREASRWAGAQETNETSSADLVSSEREHDVCNRKTDDKEVDKGVAWNCAAKPFVPQCCRKGKVHVGHAKPHEEKSGPVLRSRRCNETKRPKSTLKLRQILQHPQVSNVRPVKKEVKDKMDKFTQCGHDEWILDLQGTTAKQVQRRLREQLIQDLKEGSDEAAFVCSQLGIDTVPRADQLELMIAAMPGVAKLVFEGTEAKSGLSMEDWRELHASHCDKGCTKDKVHDECYFRVIHHFLQCGYDPELEEGRSWEEFKKHFPAYVDMWRGDEERCRAAWKKWVDNSAGLLDELTEEEPDFAVPLLPATRSKHKWRYLKYGIPYKVRLCLDFKAAQVNAATQDWKFRYRALDDIAASVQKGDWLASVDISRFYLRLPAGQKLRTVQWVQDPGSYAQSTKLNNKSKRKLWRKLTAIGFGLKTAPAWASVVSAELVRILTKSGVRVVGCFLDDLLIAGASKQECQAALDKAIKQDYEEVRFASER